MRPVCLNFGCNSPVTSSGGRYRSFCSNCHKAGYDPKTELKENVKPFKTGKCSNQNGRLGYSCPINYKKASWSIGFTEIDHIDRDWMNNTPENCQELCAVCHIRKSMENGDLKNLYLSREQLTSKMVAPESQR